MAVKDISDLQVVQAIAEWKANREKLADQLLMEKTKQCWKVCDKALERAYRRDLIECGVSVRSGWLTEKGQALLDANKQS